MDNDAKVHIRAMSSAHVVMSSCPFIEFKVDLYIAAKVDVQLNYYDKKQIEFIKPLKTEMEKFRVPIAFLNAIADGDLKKLGQIKVVERDCHYVTLDIPGFGETKLKDSLITSFSYFFRGRRVGQALADAGLLPFGTGVLIDAVPAHGLLPPKTSQEISAGPSSVDNSDVVAALRTLGYTTKEIQKMVGSAGLTPGMSTEEKVQAVFKNMNT
jgi:hypothetical protein